MVFSKKNLMIPAFLLVCSQVFATISIDAAAFLGDEGQASLEIYYTIPRNELNWQKENDSFIAEIPIITHIAFRGNIIFADTSRIYDKCKNPQLLEAGQSLPHQMNLSIPPGIYTATVTLPMLKQSASTEIIIPSFAGDELQLSNIQCISDLAEPSPGSIFNKYGQYAVIPYPQRLYSLDYPVLNFLFEIYNMSYQAENPGNFQIEARILDLNNKTVMDLGTESYTVTRKNFPSIHSYDISALSGGTMNLVLIVSDLKTGKKAETRKKIYMLNPGESVDFLAADNPLAMSEKELDSLYYILQPLLSNTEKKLYKNSKAEGKKSFFTSFWEMRDPKPETPHNEYQLEINRRIEYANEHFTSLYRSGATTDKGIILLKYGFPDDVQVYRSSSDTKPYEIWSYFELEGGVQFYFGDISGFNQFELIHSTKHDEYQDPNWQSKLNY